ncbi:MAG TPA: hypothetical protein VE544_12610 [Nitrososphaeraceae archaeon]|nr:hypothetical protein [Nitrososphaeraceae archaeon]
MSPNEQLVSIDGLKFKPYQMLCMEVLARKEGYGNVKQWLNQKIISHLIVPLLSVHHEDFTNEMLDKLKQDGYGS